MIMIMMIIVIIIIIIIIIVIIIIFYVNYYIIIIININCVHIRNSSMTMHPFMHSYEGDSIRMTLSTLQM